jgi:N-acetylneuraminic acid mutarotase
VRAYATNSAGTGYGKQLSFTTSLKQAAEPTHWPQLSNFPGGARYSAASFSIGTKMYIGIGYNDADLPVRDFWEWDQATNIWTRKAVYPGNSTGIVVCFSIGTKGYIGTGNDFKTNGFTNEFWEYDPETDSWTQKASLPSSPARALAVGFSIGSKGYIGIGNKNPFSNGNLSDYYQDFWEWDQATNVWTKKADFPGNTRSGAVGFSIGNKGYIGTGKSDGASYTKDFWEWDQATNIWTKKADFAGNPRESAVGFSIGNKGYIGTGYTGNGDGNAFYKDFWEWDQATNLWTKKSDFTGDARASAFGVSIGNKGYIGTGGDGSSINYAFHDLWEYDPK